MLDPNRRMVVGHPNPRAFWVSAVLALSPADSRVELLVVHQSVHYQTSKEAGNIARERVALDETWSNQIKSDSTILDHLVRIRDFRLSESNTFKVDARI